MSKYFSNWKEGRDAIICDLIGYEYDRKTQKSIPHTTPNSFPTEDEIIFASYTYEDYSGDAILLWERDGKLYEVTGSHCSCNGLEGCYAPEEINWAMLKLRVAKADEMLAKHPNNHYFDVLSGHSPEARSRFRELVNAH